MAEDEEREARLLASMARRAAERDRFFASLLGKYAMWHQMDDTALCAYLECDLYTLNRLRLCTRPNPEPIAFALNIRRIAETLDLDPGLLAGLVREVDVQEAIDKAADGKGVPFSTTSGLMSAARDHERTPDGADSAQPLTDTPPEPEEGE